MSRTSRKATDELVKTDASKSYYQTAVYIRLSVENSGKNDDGMSIENQKKICLDYLKSHPDLKLYDIYEDNGRKGTNTERPEFKRMIEDVQKRKVNCIIVKDLSRFSRNYIDAGKYLETVFPFMGVRFISITDHFDSLVAEGDEKSLMVPLKNMLNTAYAKDISRKIITSFRERQRRCQILPSFGPYGYVKSKTEAFRYELDRDVAPYVKLIFDWTIDGKSCSEIIHYLEDHGVASPAKRKYELGLLHNEKYLQCHWNTHSLIDIMRNPTYTGCIVYGRMPRNLSEGIPLHNTDRSEWLIFPDMHEAIVSQEQYDEVQKILDDRSNALKKKKKASKKRWSKIVDCFKGRIYCADCGYRMRFIKEHNSGKSKVRSRYACGHYLDSRNKECSRHNVLAEEVEDCVSKAINEQREFLQQIENEKNKIILKNQETYNSKMRFLAGSLNVLVEKKNNLYENYVEKKMNQDDYISEKKVLDEECEDLERQMKKLEKLHRDFLSVFDNSNEWLQAVQQPQKEKKLTPQLVESLIERIRVFEGEKIEIEFKFIEGKKRFEQILSAEKGDVN